MRKYIIACSNTIPYSILLPMSYVFTALTKLLSRKLSLVVPLTEASHAVLKMLAMMSFFPLASVNPIF